MKVASNNLYASYATQKETAKLQTTDRNQRKISKNFDKISIHSDTTPTSNDTFASTLTSKLSQEVRRPASQEQLNTLRQKVADGTYQIDLDAIVKKMLL